MKNINIILTSILFIVLPNMLVAVEIKYDKIEYNGDTFEKVTVKEVSTTHVKISHKAGVAVLDFRYLSDEVKKNLGYDKEKADKKRKEVQKANQRQRELQIKQAQKVEFIRKLDEFAEHRQFEVMQVLTDGLLVWGMKGDHRSALRSEGYVTIIENIRIDGTIHFVRLYPGQNLAKGDRISGRFARHGTYSYTDTQGAKQTVPQQIFTREGD